MLCTLLYEDTELKQAKLELICLFLSTFPFFIISSLHPSWGFGLSPGGLATDGYDGHVFWDQETWMFPPLVLLHQNLARTCLAYRFERLQAAKDKAKKYGFKGKCKFVNSK